MGETTQAPAKAGKAKAGEAPELPSLDTVASALFGDERFKDLMGELVRAIMPSANDVAQEVLVLIVEDDRRKPLVDAVAVALLSDESFKVQLCEHFVNQQMLTDILANDGFVAGVGNLITARVQSDDFPETVRPAIDDYLNVHLPELVEAAMPETPEKRAAREAEAREKAAAQAKRADRVAAEKRGKAAAKLAEERAGRKVDARDRRAALLSLPTDEAEFMAARAPVDLAAVKRGSLLLDDGTAVSIDFTQEVAPDALQAWDGGDVLLKAKAIHVGSGMPEAFRVEAVLLVLELGEGEFHRVLRCPMPTALIVGGGFTAQLGEDSLLFRPI